MSLYKSVLAMSVAALAAVACTASTEQPDETSSQTQDELRADPCAVMRCAAGTHCVAKGKRASCVPDKGAGEVCGAVTCGSGQVCCNASCGICTDPGGACIQIACSSPQ